MTALFRTKPVANTQTVLYSLSLRAPVVTSLELSTYTFPLSPTALRTERSSLSSFSDTQGPSLSQGVTRVMDTYGLAPPIFTIEGTTGWDFHSADGYSLSGLESMQQLALFLATYADLNQTQKLLGTSYLYTLEFYDYFTSNFWQIEPIGPQIFHQDAQRPILTYYRFKWAATKPAGLIPDLLDTVGNALTVAPSIASTNLSQSLTSTTSNYTAAGEVGATTGTVTATDLPAP